MIDESTAVDKTHGHEHECDMPTGLARLQQVCSALKQKAIECLE